MWQHISIDQPPVFNYTTAHLPTFSMQFQLLGPLFSLFLLALGGIEDQLYLHNEINAFNFFWDAVDFENLDSLFVPNATFDVGKGSVKGITAINALKPGLFTRKHSCRPPPRRSSSYKITVSTRWDRPPRPTPPRTWPSPTLAEAPSSTGPSPSALYSRIGLLKRPIFSTLEVGNSPRGYSPHSYVLFFFPYSFSTKWKLRLLLLLLLS